MKIKKQRKLSIRLMAIVTCGCLIAETLSGYGVLTVQATTQLQTDSNQETTSLEDVTDTNEAVSSTDSTSSTTATSSTETTSSNEAASTTAATISTEATSSSEVMSSTEATSSSDTITSGQDTTPTTIASTDTVIVINETYFPDSIFLNYVCENFDLNKDNKLSKEELTCVTEIDVSNLGISSLKGLEYFINLKELNCSNNRLTTLALDTLANLSSLDCSWNQLTSLDLTNNLNLTTLDCDANARSILVDDENSFDLASLLDFNIDQASNWSCTYTITDNLLAFDNDLESPVITYSSCLNNANFIDDEITCTLILYIDDFASVSINEETFPDTEFNNLIATYDIDEDHSLSTEELASITNMDISTLTISDLTGIQYFKNLAYFNYNTEQKENVNISLIPTITTIYCDHDLLITNESTESEDTDATSDSDSAATIINSSDTTNDSNMTEESTDSPTISADTIINTKLPADTSTAAYTVTFDTSGGSFIDSIVVNANTAIGSTHQPSDPTKIGYEFSGWYKESSNSHFKFSTHINSDITVYAHWNAIEYSISYNLDNGNNSADAPMEFTIEETKSLPSPTRKEYQFDGWFLDNNFTTSISSITPGMSSNITLYAKWTQLFVSSSTNITKTKNSGKGKLSVSYNSLDGVSGYEVLCSTSKKFKSNIRTTTSRKTTLTVKGLIKNKTYYVKVRGYLVDSAGEKVYGNYSSVKKTKIKSGIVEATATSTSATIKSCKITNSDTVTVKAKTSKIIKSKDSYYYLFSVPSTQSKLSKLKPIATSEKSTSVTFTADLDKNGSNNLLQSKFVVAVKQKSGYKIISSFKYISNPEGAAEYTYDFPTAPTKKGLQGYSTTLGVNHTVLNIEVNDLIATSSEYNSSSTDQYSYKGKTYYFRHDVANQYAYTARDYSDDGAIVYAILLLGWSSKPNLIAPGARTEGYSYYAWNMKDKKVKEQLEAVITYFAEYCCKVCGDGPGIAGWIVGNEVDNFDTWNYAGTSNLDSYAKIYADTFRLVYNATKSIYSNARVYISLDHMWSMSNEGSYGSKTFLSTFNSILKSEGNIDWDIAYHPYPVPLTDPDFWNNDYLSNSENSPIVNMKNLSVLTNYVKKNYGKDKRVILSEVGFTSDSGEKIQAAAIAYAYYVAEFNPMVDAFIMRSLQDADVEVAQGLSFGITGKQAYNVYKYMDTPQSASYTKFALKVIGSKKWKSIVPKYNSKKFSSMPNR
ncbi:MAG: DUF5722 domain-containing protein [Lachnotalea sp.]